MSVSAIEVSQQPGHILVVEDQFEVREAISMLLSGQGHRITVSSSPEDALECVTREQYELILLDMNYRRDTTSGTEGLRLLTSMRSRGVDAPVIAMTAWGSVDVSVQAMHSGACDFVQKPWDNAQLLRLVTQHINEQRLRQQSQRREMLEREDAVAVQRRLMPSILPTVKGLSLAAFSRPYGYIGGDYYDVFEMGDKIAVCIGDVIGKGVPAALLMSNLQAAVKVTAAQWVSPSDVCGRVNELVCSNAARDRFVSFFYAVIHRVTKEIRYCNCGHNAPILLRANGSCERLERGGTLLGLRPNEYFEEGAVRLKAGDRLLLFTDGLSEAENEFGDSLGDERLIETLRNSRARDAERILEEVIQSASTFCNSRFHDDVTAVLLNAELANDPE